MAIVTKDSQQADETSFADSFNEESTAAPSQSEDEAFGLGPESGESTEQGAPGVVIEIAPGQSQSAEGADQTAEEAAETPAVETGEGAAGETAENTSGEAAEPVQEDWEQKYKTLQGKYNAEVGGARETGEVQGNPDGSSGQVASADEAMSKLSEDFGPEFVQMITAIASAIAGKAAQEVASKTIEVVDRDVKDIIAHLQDKGQQDHFEKVSGAHPDFMEIAKSPEFASWLAARPPEEQAIDQRILTSGNAREIVGLLTEFRAAAGPVDDGSADAAEGVRSGRTQLPASPEAGPSDYADAWNQA